MFWGFDLSIANTCYLTGNIPDGHDNSSYATFQFSRLLPIKTSAERLRKTKHEEFSLFFKYPARLCRPPNIEIGVAGS